MALIFNLGESSRKNCCARLDQARLAQLGSVKGTLKDGQEISGILMEETKEEIILKTSDAEPVEIKLSRIEKKENMVSAMPPMGTLLSKREIRDMVEYLANLKK